MSIEKPIPPAANECCESACSPCVWDIYFEELNAWNADQKASMDAEKHKAETKTEQN